MVRAEIQSAPDMLAFSGRIESVHRIEIRPRVTGPLTAVHYREGETVLAGAPLFEIDSRPYRARRDQHAAEAARAEAAVILSQQELARARQLRGRDLLLSEGRGKFGDGEVEQWGDLKGGDSSAPFPFLLDDLRHEVQAVFHRRRVTAMRYIAARRADRKPAQKQQVGLRS